MLLVGEVFAGKYRIERELGRGAFAVVYLAVNDELQRHVAVKVLQAGRGDDRFVREAKLLSELTNPHTVTLLDFGRTDSGQLYMSFEYVAGETLGDRLAHTGPMPAGRVVHILRQILSSLAEAHDRGIVHRDIKPANIMLTERGGDQDFVKLLDFGVAKPMDDMRDVSVELTIAGQLVGTMRYMAPEQIRGERKAVPASDVYAAGLIAYELLTGMKAAAGDDGQSVVLSHLNPEPFLIPPSIEIPQSFRTAFEAMMLKDIARRPRNAREALRVLDALEDNEVTVTRDKPVVQSFGELEIDEEVLRENRFKPQFGPAPSGRFEPSQHMATSDEGGFSLMKAVWFLGIVLVTVVVVFAAIRAVA